MTQDAKRRPGQEPQRHAVGITRTCLASGTMQLPFALAGTLPQGELLVQDAEAGEPIVLWSEPPRRLAGLAPFFERHELHVNDAVVLEIDGDEVRMTVSKRPRRTRPIVQPSTWTSVHDDAPEPAREPEPDADRSARPTHGAADVDDADADGHERPRRRFELGPDRSDERLPDQDRWTSGRPSSAAGRHEDDVRDDTEHDAWKGYEPDAAPVPDDASYDDAAYDDAAYDDAGYERMDDPHASASMPRAPRVTVKPADEGNASSGRPLPTSASMPPRQGPFAGLRRLTRSLFGRGDDENDGRGGGREAEDAPDWTSAWDADEEEDVPTPGFTPGEARKREPVGDARPDESLSVDAPVDDEPYDDGVFDDGAFDDGAFDDGALHDAAFDDGSGDDAKAGGAPDDDRFDDETPRSDVRAGDAFGDAFGDASFLDDGFEAEARPDALPFDVIGEDVRRAEPATTDTGAGDDELGPTPLFPEAAPPRGPVRRPVDETPSGVPPRAERFLGGDLRTRLLRYLESPEMGAVAKVERIAKRFDLDEATTAEMLADIADDPPEGLRLRSVREGAWRIERTLGR